MILNKRGQTLIMFILLFPLIIIICAFVVDFGLIAYNETHLREVTKLAIKDNVDFNVDKIKKEIKENKVNIDNLVIEVHDNKIIIKNEIEIESIFGALVGLKTYRVKINISATNENDKIRF